MNDSQMEQILDRRIQQRLASVTCECGESPVRRGAFMICGNPSCDGYGQVCGAARQQEEV